MQNMLPFYRTKNRKREKGPTPQVGFLIKSSSLVYVFSVIIIPIQTVSLGSPSLTSPLHYCQHQSNDGF